MKLEIASLNRIKRISKFHHIPYILTEEERKEVCVKLGKAYIDTFNFYKYYNGKFSIEFIPDYQYACIELSMNHRRYEGFPQHKSNLRYFIDAKHRPRTLAYSIDGIVYDGENKKICEDEVVKIIADENKSVFKYANYTGGGKDVHIIESESYNERVNVIRSLLKSTNRDWLAQSVIKQLPEMAKLGYGSINTIRVLSLYLGDEVHILSTFVRIGGENSFVDNLHSGHGILVGVKSDGSFHSWGIDGNYTKVLKSPSGTLLSSFRIPNYEKIIDFVKKTHQNFQQCHLIGWDITIDENGEIIVIEVNLDSAEISAHQIFNGPILGNYYQEVLKYIKSHPPVKMIPVLLSSSYYSSTI